MSEHDEQVAVVEWFELQYPKLAKCLIAIPNGAYLAGSPKKRAYQMVRLKKEGFKTGVSDLFLAVPAGKYAGLWLEMKDHNKTKCSVSDAQWDHINLMNEHGYYATWAAGAESAMAIIENYMGEI